MAIRCELEALLKEKSILPEELAEATGLPLKTILTICKGNNKEIYFGDIDVICDALECEPWDILKHEKRTATLE